MARKSAKNKDPNALPNEDRLARTLVESMASDLIATGKIRLDGKTDDEALTEILAYLESAARKQKKIIRLQINYGPGLLEQARECRDRGESLISCLLFATWFEHFFNGAIHYALSKMKWSDSDIQQTLRELRSIEPKYTWFLRILGLRPIYKTHRSIIKYITETRNGFVHYKWKGIELDDPNDRKEQARLEVQLINVEKTIKYLRMWENREFFDNRGLKLFRPKR